MKLRMVTTCAAGGQQAAAIHRYGGEEFVLVLEGAGRERAAAAAEELRAAVEEEGRELDGHRVELTASIGVTAYRPDDRAQDLLARGDAALYRAKQEGRNRVVLDMASAAEESSGGRLSPRMG